MVLRYLPNESVILTLYAVRRFLTVRLHNTSHASSEQPVSYDDDDDDGRNCQV